MVDSEVRSLRALEGRWISDEPSPGWVEVDFLDAMGRRWTVADKPPIFSRCLWAADTSTPLDLTIGCHIESVEDGKAIVRLAWGVGTITGETTFLVRLTDLTER